MLPILKLGYNEKIEENSFDCKFVCRGGKGVAVRVNKTLISMFYVQGPITLFIIALLCVRSISYSS